MMILWETEALNDRVRIFEYLYAVNPLAAEKTDAILEAKAESLLTHPLIGVQRDGMRGRLLIIPEIGMLMSYWVQGSTIHVIRVLHQKQQFPDV